MFRLVFSVGVAALSSRPLQKQTLAILLLAVAGATGVMGRNASADIVTATLNQTATNRSPVYFSYDSGVIGTLDFGSTNTLIAGSVNSYFGSTFVYVDANYGYSEVAILSPLSFGTLISNTTDWGFGKNANADGYYGVRFSAGGADWNYGWVAVSKTASSLTFGEASVETTINTPIAAGAVAIPEPSTCASLFAGLACGGYLRFRRRKQA
jgi:hypothetical protein